MLLNEIVVGNTLEAQAYCFLTPGSHILVTRQPDIFPFELLSEKILNTKNKLELHSRFLFMNSMLGKVLLADMPDSVRISDSTCSVISGTEKTTFYFEKCSIFDTLDLVLPEFEQVAKQDKLKVVDFFEARGIKKEYDFSHISTGDKFVSKIWPYNSGRVMGSRYVTDFYTESIVPCTAISDFNNSETMAKFKLYDHLEASRFSGTLSNITDDKRKVYSKIALEHIERFVRQPKAIYKDTETVKFNSLPLQEIFFEEEK